MKTARLRVVRMDPGCTDGIIGRLHYPEKRIDDKWVVRSDLCTLELSDRGNKKGCSCVNEGLYELERKYSGRFYRRYNARWGHEFVVRLKDVPGRSEVLLHIGNTTKDSHGCLLVAESYRANDHSCKFVFKSTEAYRRLYAAFVDMFNDHDKVTLEITSEVHKSDDQDVK